MKKNSNQYYRLTVMVIINNKRKRVGEKKKIRSGQKGRNLMNHIPIGSTVSADL